jgi:hypothetical protein
MSKIKLLFLLFLINSFEILSQNTIKADSLLKTRTISIQAEGIGGFQGECIMVEVVNNSLNEIYVEIESGRRFVSFDSSEQDILIVKPSFIKIAPRKTKLLKLFGFCCQQKNSAPKKKSKFYHSYMSPKKWQELTNYLNINPSLQISSMQSAIWSMSNDLPVRNIGKNNKMDEELRKQVCKIKNIEIPWYNITFNESEFQLGDEIDSLKHLLFCATLELKIPHSGLIEIFILDKNNRVVKYLMKDVIVSDGLNSFVLEHNIATLAKGKYKLALKSEYGFYYERNFEI